MLLSIYTDADFYPHAHLADNGKQDLDQNTARAAEKEMKRRRGCIEEEEDDQCVCVCVCVCV